MAAWMIPLFFSARKESLPLFNAPTVSLIYAAIGHVEMEADKLKDNFCALLSTLIRMKPNTAKGVYLRSITLSSTMGPGIKIDAQDAHRTAERR
jgi:large subunit ribosomal protein L1